MSLIEQDVYDTTMLFGIAAAGYGLFLSNIDQVVDDDLKDRCKRRHQAEVIVTVLIVCFGWALSQVRGNGRGIVSAILVSAFYVGVFELVAAKPERWM